MHSLGEAEGTESNIWDKTEVPETGLGDMVSFLFSFLWCVPGWCWSCGKAGRVWWGLASQLPMGIRMKLQSHCDYGVAPMSCVWPRRKDHSKGDLFCLSSSQTFGNPALLRGCGFSDGASSLWRLSHLIKQEKACNNNKIYHRAMLINTEIKLYGGVFVKHWDTGKCCHLSLQLRQLKFKPQQGHVSGK